MQQVGLAKQLVDHHATVVLAGTALGNANHIKVGADIALGAVLAPHECSDRAQAGSQGQHGLRPFGCGCHQGHHVGNDAAHLVPSGRHGLGRWQCHLGGLQTDRVCGLQCIEQLARWVVAVHDDLTVELKLRIGLPATVERQLVDRAGANALRREAAPTACGGLGLVFLRSLRPGLEQWPAIVTKGAFDGHANAHPTVVVQIGVDDVPQGSLDGFKGSALLRQVGALDRGTQANPQALWAQICGDQPVGLLGELARLGLRDAG